MLRVTCTRAHSSCRRRHHDDSDWLTPGPSSTSLPLALPAFDGVWRIESQGEEGVPFPSLYDAIQEEPRSPEAEIRGAGGTLAMADQGEARWVLTRLGECARRRERGQVAA